MKSNPSQARRTTFWFLKSYVLWATLLPTCGMILRYSTSFCPRNVIQSPREIILPQCREQSCEHTCSSTGDFYAHKLFEAIQLIAFAQLSLFIQVKSTGGFETVRKTNMGILNIRDTGHRFNWAGDRFTWEWLGRNGAATCNQQNISERGRKYLESCIARVQVQQRLLSFAENRRKVLKMDYTE